MTALNSPARPTCRSRVLPAGRVALPPWGLARGVVAGGWLLARCLERNGRVDDPLAHGPVRQRLLAWDGAFYADVAGHGCAALPRPALRFFPLTPILGRVVGWLGFGPR